MAGPIALMDCTEAYAQFSDKGVTILPAGTVYAYNWREVGLRMPCSLATLVQQAGSPAVLCLHIRAPRQLQDRNAAPENCMCMGGGRVARSLG